MTNTRREILGMPHATAACQLKKQLLFQLVQETDKDCCYRCGSKIESVEELSVEHKEAWRKATDPVAAFWDLTNIAYSHLDCNRDHGRRREITHGLSGYVRGCRCEICKEAKKLSRKY